MFIRHPFGFAVRRGCCIRSVACSGVPDIRVTRRRPPAPPPPATPVVTTLSVAESLESTAYCVVDPDGATLVTVGFCWTPNPDVAPTVEDNSLQQPYTTPEFSIASIEGPREQRNYGRSFVIDSAGTIWYSADTYPFYTGLCLLDGTLVATWSLDGSSIVERPIESLWYDDVLVAWDFDNGKLCAAKPLWIKRGAPTTQYVVSVLTNNKTLCTVGAHRVLPVDSSSGFTPVQASQRVVTLNTHTLEVGSAVVASQTLNVVDGPPRTSHNIITDRHLNLFADGVLTSCRFNNRKPIVTSTLTFAQDGVGDANDETATTSNDEERQAYVRGLRASSAPAELQAQAAAYILNMWRTRARSVLFLDHQGVMRVDPVATPGHLADFHPQAVQGLNVLLEADPALEVVLISDWQHWVPLPVMQEFYTGQGVLRPPVAYAGGGGAVPCRCGRVLQWLGEQCKPLPSLELHRVPPPKINCGDALSVSWPPCSDNGIGARWLAIDDLPLATHLPEAHTLQTEPRVGLTDPAVVAQAKAKMWWLRHA